MTDRIILHIFHSDDYTDYLFLTAALTNKHVIPMIDPRRSEVASQFTPKTRMLYCYNSRSKEYDRDAPVLFDERHRKLCVYTRYFMDDNGIVDPHKADYVRALIEKVIVDLLTDPTNLMEIYRDSFPLLWKHRDIIYSNPQYFFIQSGWRGLLFDDYLPIGVVLKTIDDEHKNFRLSLRGDCGCSEAPLLIDYQDCFNGRYFLTLHTWCPICGNRRMIKTKGFLREGYCNSALESARRYYDKGQGFSTLSLLDLVDILPSG